MMGKLHLGIRHELVLVWLVLFMASRAVKYWWSGLLVGVMVLLLIGCWPMTMTYSNVRDVMRWHSDSDYDWGNGLFYLKKEVDRIDINNLQLAYFGNVEPERYGIDYIRVKDASFASGKKVETYDETKPLVVSMTCWQTCGYMNNERLKDKEKEIIVGGFVMVK